MLKLKNELLLDQKLNIFIKMEVSRKGIDINRKWNKLYHKPMLLLMGKSIIANSFVSIDEIFHNFERDSKC